MRRPTFFALAAVIVGIDQLTKWLVLRDKHLGTITVLRGYFDLTYVHNSGGAFGIFQNRAPVLAFACLVAVVAISAYVIRERRKLSWLLGCALALPLGGATGNMIDRMRFGRVTDFLHVHAGQYDFPVFNVADSAICVGVALLLIYSWKSPREGAAA